MNLRLRDVPPRYVMDDGTECPEPTQTVRSDFRSIKTASNASVVARRPPQNQGNYSVCTSNYFSVSLLVSVNQHVKLWQTIKTLEFNFAPCCNNQRTCYRNEVYWSNYFLSEQSCALTSCWIIPRSHSVIELRNGWLSTAADQKSTNRIPPGTHARSIISLIGIMMQRLCEVQTSSERGFVPLPLNESGYLGAICKLSLPCVYGRYNVTIEIKHHNQKKYLRV